MVRFPRKKSIYIFVFLFSFLVWVGYETYDFSARKGCSPLDSDVIDLNISQSSPVSLKFIALGDTGTGDQDQKEIAQAVQKICTSEGCDFVLMLGDNFYPDGVDSTEDPFFKKIFEDIYSSTDKPFIAVLGNHDVRKNPLAQVRYSLKSSKWRMPNLSYQFQAGPARFFAINSNCHFLAWQELKNQISTDSSSEVPPWTFVFGHHPVYSSGTHGDSDLIMRWYWQQFLQNSIDFYLSGHDHELEHLQRPGETSDYVVSGAGGRHYRSPVERAKTRPSQIDSKFVYQDTGFAWFQVNNSQARMKFFNAEGQELYEFSKTK
ncbi:MAG: metallophosphoesterase [SAR324 cluster bacterium]|nr:metallophosphoesterase [SAR324 cluster bacterium]